MGVTRVDSPGVLLMDALLPHPGVLPFSVGQGSYGHGSLWGDEASSTEMVSRCRFGKS